MKNHKELTTLSSLQGSRPRRRPWRQRWPPVVLGDLLLQLVGAVVAVHLDVVRVLALVLKPGGAIQSRVVGRIC